MGRILVVGSVLAVAACGGGGSRTTPSRPSGIPSSPSPPPAAIPWTLAGQVVTTLTSTPVGGAVIAAGELQATTDADGRFELRRDTAPASPLVATVSAPGYLSRETRIIHPRSSPLVVDLISDRQPFDLTFYRALARGSETGELHATVPWTRAATFYIQTVDDTGRAVEPEVLAMIREWIPPAFLTWTSGRFAAQIEEGTEVRADTPGVVRVQFVRKPEGLVCGRATVGGNYGWMKLFLDGCDCGSRKVDPAVLWHEVGHVAGFMHVEGRHLMAPQLRSLCNLRVEVSDLEQHHARIVYTRPRGNLDPDRDPPSFAFLQPSDGMPRQTVSCSP